MPIDETLKRAGIRWPVTMLWFSAPQAALGLIFTTGMLAASLWFARGFYFHPEQMASRRAAWMGWNHGMAGMIFWLGMAGLSAFIGANAARRLGTSRSALAIASDGVCVHPVLSRQRRIGWDEIDCVKIERRYTASRIPFWKDRLSLDLVLYRKPPPGQPEPKPIKLFTRFIEGGHRRACRFADTLDRAIALRVRSDGGEANRGEG